MKVCCTCKVSKPATEFHKHSGQRDGLYPQCKPCRRVSRQRAYATNTEHREHVKAKQRERRAENPVRAKDMTYRQTYGIGYEDKLAMMDAQGFMCAVCGGGLRADKFSHVDHDHDTGANRMILCHNCNTGLGLFKDSSELLRSAAEYLKGFGE